MRPKSNPQEGQRIHRFPARTKLPRKQCACSVFVLTGPLQMFKSVHSGDMSHST